MYAQGWRNIFPSLFIVGGGGGGELTTDMN